MNPNKDFSLVLAPLASVSDKAFRALCIHCGAKETYTEMVSAKGLYYKNERTWEYIFPSEYEKQFNVQIFGNDPQIMVRVSKEIENKLGANLQSIDINMGCPVKKVVKNGEGCALFNKPELAAKIIYEINKSINCPVTAKIRCGYESVDEIATLHLCKKLLDAGASNICIHGRSKAQAYHGQANWEVLKLASKEFGADKISGSGDIFTYQDAISMALNCNINKVFAARGAMKNPYIFSGIIPDKNMRLKLALIHLDYHKQLISNEYYNNLKTNMVCYLHNFSGSKELRATLMQQNTYDGYRDAILYCLDKDK